jgi:chitosanase
MRSETFDTSSRTVAAAVVRVFETGSPTGRYSAVAVLDDGAGISYGISQFTHRSGSLLKVVRRYLDNGGPIGRRQMLAVLSTLSKNDPASIQRLANDRRFKEALRSAAASGEMREAQDRIAEADYLVPAMTECRRRGFVEPLSLAVIYDSFVHGSFQRIARRVAAVRGERAWITAYVRKRHEWLRSIPRLRATSYRTAFFLGEILKQNWQLATPLTVNGRRINMPRPSKPELSGETYEREYDTSQDDSVTNKVLRTDGRRSLWATVLGSIGQAAFAVGGFLAGLPVEVWLGAALIIAVLIIVYLYRQLTLGRIREAGCRRCAQEKYQ